MRLFDWWRDRYRANQAQAALEQRAVGNTIAPWHVGRPQWARSDIHAFDEQAFRKVVLAWRCVQYLANATGSAPIRVYDELREEVDDAHPLRTLLARPNPEMGEGRFLARLAMSMAVAGFTVVEKERSRNGEVIGLWPLRPDWLMPVPRQHAQADWEYRVPGYNHPFLLPAEDVIPIPFADTPDGSPIGIGPTELMLREAQISNALTDFLKVFLDRGALPLYAIIPNDEGAGAAQWKRPETRDAFMEAWKQRYGGLSNAAHEPLPLVGVKDVKPIGFDFNQLAYPELNDLTDARICAAFGVPPVLVGAQVGLDRSTFNNNTEMRKSFYEDTMSYLWGRIDDAFTRHLLPEFEARPGWDIHFDTANVPALQDNVNERWQRATSAATAGLISTHQFAREVGLDPQGADVFLRGFATVEVPVTPVRSARRAPIAAVRQPLALPEPRFRHVEGRTYRNVRALSPRQVQVRNAITATTQMNIAGLAQVLAPRVDRFFAGQRERILAATRSAGAAPEARGVDAIDWANEDELLRRIFAGWWEELQQAALAQAGTVLGDEPVWNVVNPYTANLDGVLAQQVVGINATTRADIEAIVKEEILDGTSPEKLGERLIGLFDQTYQGRHLTIARTESMHAYAEASTMAYEASGQVEQVEILDNAAHAEPYSGAADGLTCSQRNHLVVPLERGTFHIYSDHPNGSASILPIVARIEDDVDDDFDWGQGLD